MQKVIIDNFELGIIKLCNIRPFFQQAQSHENAYQLHEFFLCILHAIYMQKLALMCI